MTVLVRLAIVTVTVFGVGSTGCTRSSDGKTRPGVQIPAPSKKSPRTGQKKGAVPQKNDAAKPVVEVQECSYEVDGIWFDRPRWQVIFCAKRSYDRNGDESDDDESEISVCAETDDDAIERCEREAKKARAALEAKRAAKPKQKPKRVCFSLDLVSGDTKKIALRRRPRTKPRVRISGKRITACPVGGHRCGAIVVQSKPQGADLSASGKLLAAFFSRANKRTKTQEKNDDQASNTWRIEIYELKSRRRLSRFVLENDEDPATEMSLQWLGEVLSVSWQMGPGSGASILDWKTGKKVRGLGHDAKPDYFATHLKRAHHVSGNRWAILNAIGNPLVIQDVMTGAVMRVKLDALYAGKEKQAHSWMSSAMVVIGPQRLVVMVSEPQIAVGVVDAENGTVLKHRILGCPPFGEH
jgi:hypothetical protein